jgi:hypothetical protein
MSKKEKQLVVKFGELVKNEIAKQAKGNGQAYFSVNYLRQVMNTAYTQLNSKPS